MAALVANPQVRAIAKKAGLAAGRGIVRGFQRRRQRKGRRVGVIFPRLIPQPQPKPRVAMNSAVTTAPVRYQATQTSISPSATAVDHGTAVLADVTATNANGPLYTITVNPTDPEFTARTAKLAALYQKLQLIKISFRFVPTKGTDTDGQFGCVFVPDVQTPVPTGWHELSQIGGFCLGPVSQPLAFDVPGTSTNKAFNYCFTGLDPSNSPTEIHTLGKLFYMVNGSAATGDPLMFGSLYADYSIKFMDPKVGDTDAVSGAIEPDNVLAGEYVDLSSPDILRGHPGFLSTPVLGVHKRKGLQGSHMLIKCETDGALPTVSYGQFYDDVSTVLTPEVSNGTHTRLLYYVVPSGVSYVSIQAGATPTTDDIVNIRVWYGPSLRDN